MVQFAHFGPNACVTFRLHDDFHKVFHRLCAPVNAVSEATDLTASALMAQQRM
jgi:hypothetical protein